MFGLSCATVSDLGAALIGRRLALRATPLFAITELTLETWTKTPLRLTRFLDDAHQLGILRQVGAVYQFRHASCKTTWPPHTDARNEPGLEASE